MSISGGQPNGDQTGNERELVERARSGDRRAFGQIYQRYVDRVYSFVVFRVRDEVLAEDLTQEAFVQALKSLPGYDWRGSLAPWLLRIARNTVIDHWRWQGRHPERTITALETDDEDEDEGRIERLAGGAGTDAAAQLESVLDWERITVAASKLTELQQQVLALRFAAGMSVRETADAMDRTEGAIKNLQHHALKALKRHVGEEDR